MQKDTKIGLLIGLALVAVLMIYIGTRPNLSLRARLLRQNSVNDEPQQVPDEVPVDESPRPEQQSVPSSQITADQPQQIRFKQFIPQPLSEESAEPVQQEEVQESPPQQMVLQPPQLAAQEIGEITPQQMHETSYETKRFYVVRRGDTLSRISKTYYGSANNWNRIYQANRGTLESPNKLKPGMKLIIPR